MPSPVVVLLRNHQAGGRAALDLFDRAIAGQRARSYADGLRTLRDECREDLDFNESVMRRLHLQASPVQVLGTRLTERVGRFKPNGRLVGRSGAPLSELAAGFSRYAASGEINSEVDDQGGAIEAVAAAFEGRGEADRVDGLTVSGPDWWVNVRPSNTEPLLRLNVEARTEEAMAALRDQALAAIRG